MDATTENIVASIRARLDPAQAESVMLKVGPVQYDMRFVAIGLAGWWVDDLMPLNATPLEVARIASGLVAALAVRPKNDGTRAGSAEAALSAAQERQP